MTQDFLLIDRISKRFGSTLAVDAAQIAIGHGEFFSLLGPSGCGKTTLLRIIAGFEHADEGDIFIDGARVTDEPPNKRPSNMVFQSYAIFPHLNVFDNIAYGLRRQGLTRDALRARVFNALAMIKLEGFEARRAGELSGGQRQRVALARALVCSPKVLLLDEPLGALDKRLRETMQIELRQLQKSVGITFVFVTHDQEEALALSDRVAVMQAGKVLQVANPRELYERPASRDVADFIGTMNFFEGRVVARENDRIVVDAGAVGRLTAASPPGERAPGESVVLAVRPERIFLEPPAEATSPSANRLTGTLAASAFLGERSHFQIAVPGRDQPIAVSTQNSGTAMHLSPGTAVTLSWPADAVLILEA
jgi:spermidine/putrescine ABC transporter ATP-binding subunit